MDHGERFNAVSHGVGTVLAAIGGAHLVTVAVRGGDPWKILACGLYALTLLVLYLTSTLGVVWALALFGIVQELCHASRARVLSLAVYLVMGWLVAVAIAPLVDALGRTGFAWLVAGGLFYTGGIVFYATDHKVRNGHGIWHLFVLAGSACHYIAVRFHVA